MKRDGHGVTEEEKCGAVTASDLNTVIVLSWQIILLYLLDHSLSERTVLSSSSSSSLLITNSVLGFFPSLLCWLPPSAVGSGRKGSAAVEKAFIQF